MPSVTKVLERFYKVMVEEALLGKDPDVAEDFTEGGINTDKIVRNRQREEICGALTRSSTLYVTYIMKNLAQVVLAIFFVFVNLYYILGELGKSEMGNCVVNITNTDRAVKFQCRQKWNNFFVILLLGTV